MSLTAEQIERDSIELAAGRCPECLMNIASANVCAACGFSNLMHAVFCGGCGKPVTVSPTTVEWRRAHAESHWGKDFDKRIKIPDATDPCQYCGEGFDGQPDEAVAAHFLTRHYGLVFDEKLFPDAVRRWKAVVSYSPSLASGSAPPPAAPKRRIVVGAALQTQATGAVAEATKS